MARGRCRRHGPHFKFQLCTDFRTGVVGRREAKRTYELSGILIQARLARYDDGEMTVADIESSMTNEYEAKIAAPRSLSGGRLAPPPDYVQCR